MVDAHKIPEVPACIVAAPGIPGGIEAHRVAAIQNFAVEFEALAAAIEAHGITREEMVEFDSIVGELNRLGVHLDAALDRVNDAIAAARL